jgi:demethylmenaquinone methyltransferase/2-methoxy-6-polyprenyl-1,4-benzoquinol methylase
MPMDDGALPEGDAKVTAVRSMFDTIAPRYDMVNRIMTFRLDVRWRRRTVGDLALAPGSLVADLACGTGDLCLELAAAGHRPIGFDLSMGMLQAARTPAPLVHADILRLPVPDRILDAATCGYALRNVVDLGAFFGELARVIRPGGRIGLLDVGQPPSRLVRTGYNIYFGKVVPFIGGLLSDRAAYRYLPRSVAYLPPAAEMQSMLAAAGFSEVEHTQLTKGLSQLLTATRA